MNQIRAGIPYVYHSKRAEEEVWGGEWVEGSLWQRVCSVHAPIRHVRTSRTKPARDRILCHHAAGFPSSQTLAIYLVNSNASYARDLSSILFCASPQRSMNYFLLSFQTNAFSNRSRSLLHTLMIHIALPRDTTVTFYVGVPSFHL
jgi:hypothetical protein